MNTLAIQKLLDLNRQFYQTFGTQFSATRMRIQPGVKRILTQVGAVEHTLDLGCGNGQLALYLLNHGYRVFYTGLDFSEVLIKIARQRLAKEKNPHKTSYTFLPADLSTDDWDQALPYTNYNKVYALAILHHLPGNTLRCQTLSKVHKLLQNTSQSKTPGLFIHSVWQFLNNTRLRNRVVPWEKAGLTSEDVEPGDYLLDWRYGGYGIRYVHQFTEDELFSTATATGFKVKETFYSDGEGGQLGLYQIWETVHET